MISNIKYLSYIVRTDADTLNKIIENIGDYYCSWEKPKLNKDTNEPLRDKDGNIKTRLINSSKQPLKKIQERLYKFLLRHISTPQYFFGGVRKKHNSLNAKYHQGNKYIFTTDLKSFFPSISNKDVFSMFIENGFYPPMARILTKLTTFNRQVPQGVPTSTFIANLVFRKTGDKLHSYCSQNGIKFSIFVDDITMSSKTDFKDKIPHIISIIKEDGYRISHKKTFYKTKNPVVTGVICQNNRIKVPNTFHKRIKKISKTVENDPRLEKKLEGIKLYVNRVASLNK